MVLGSGQHEALPNASGRLSIARGKTYQLRLEVELKQAVSHARLTLPRPCGMELVRLPASKDGLVSIDARDDAVHFFIERWAAERHTGHVHPRRGKRDVFYWSCSAHNFSFFRIRDILNAGREPTKCAADIPQAELSFPASCFLPPSRHDSASQRVLWHGVAITQRLDWVI